MKEFMISMVNQYVIGYDRARFAVVGFGTIAAVQVTFQDSLTKEDLIEKINDTQLLSKNSSLGSRNTTE